MTTTTTPYSMTLKVHGRLPIITIPKMTTLYHGTSDPHHNDEEDVIRVPLIVSQTETEARWRAMKKQPGVNGIPRIIVYHTTGTLRIIHAQGEDGYQRMCDTFGFVTSLRDIHDEIEAHGYDGWTDGTTLFLLTPSKLCYDTTDVLLLPVHTSVVSEALRTHQDIISAQKLWSNRSDISDEIKAYVVAGMKEISTRFLSFLDLLIDQDCDIDI